MQHLVAEMRSEVELQTRRVGLQLAIQIHGARRFVERAHHAAHLAVLVAREHRLPVEPAQGQAVMLAQAHQVVGVQRESSLADAFRRSLEVGEVVAGHFLMRANQQMRELPPGGAGLRQQLGDRRLQQVLRKQERGFERHACCAARALPGHSGLRFRIAVEKPARFALKKRRQQAEHVFRRHALAALDHGEVGDRRGPARIKLDAAGRQLFEGQPVAFAQGAQLGAEEMALAGVLGHGSCEINIVNFPQSNLFIPVPILPRMRTVRCDSSGGSIS